MNTFSKFLRSIFPNPFLKYRSIIFEISKLTTIKPTVLHKYICRYNILRQFEFYHHNDGNYSHNFHKVFPYRDMIQQISALLMRTIRSFFVKQNVNNLWSSSGENWKIYIPQNQYFFKMTLKILWKKPKSLKLIWEF